MKTGIALATTLFAIASFPLLAQQSPATPPDTPGSPTTQQKPTEGPPTEAPPPAEAAPPSNNDAAAAATPAGPAVEMSPVNGELLSKLDSKTAKTGDAIEIQTKASAKTADGTEIPKGSKLVGHVLAAQPGGAGENSQVALVFDHVELKGGQSVPIHSQIQSIAPAGGAGPASGGSAAMGGPPAGVPSNPTASGMNGGSAAASGGATGAPQGTGGYAGATPQANSAPAPGTVVGKTGQIAISTTSIPGVLLANNAPGQQDPRMARASSILLGAKQDIQLDSGTQMTVGVASAAGGAAQ